MPKYLKIKSTFLLNNVYSKIQKKATTHSGDGGCRAQIDKNTVIYAGIDSASSSQNDVESTESLKVLILRVVKALPILTGDNDTISKTIINAINLAISEMDKKSITACASYVIRIGDKAFVINYGDTGVLSYDGNSFKDHSFNCLNYNLVIKKRGSKETTPYADNFKLLDDKEKIIHPKKRDILTDEVRKNKFFFFA